MEQLYKAGLAKPDTQITRDKVTVYQIRSDKPKSHVTFNGSITEKSDAEAVSKDLNTFYAKPIIESVKSCDIPQTITSEASITSDISATVTSDVTQPMTVDVATTVTSDVATTLISDAPTIVISDVAITTTSNTLLLPATSTCTVLPTTTSSTVVSNVVPNASSNSEPTVTFDDTPAVTATKHVSSSVSNSEPNSVPSEENSITSSKETEDVKEIKIGQKRPATEVSSPTPKRTRALLHSNLQQFLEGKGSAYEDDTAKTQSQPTSITGMNAF